MIDDTVIAKLGVAIERRILNEFESKILNEERVDQVAGSRQSDRSADHSDMLFHCECDETICEESIAMSAEEYRRVHNKTKHFVVVPSHVRLELEEIIASFNTYVLVAKFFPRAHAV
jgi:hypothetical protein